MVPPHECLGTDHLLRGQFHDRLVDQHQFIAFDRLAQVGLQFDAIQHRGMHATLVQHGARLAACLGVVHRHVGVAQHLVGRLLWQCARDADAGVQVHVLAFHLPWSCECRRDACGDVHHLAFTAHLLQQDRELVTAEACGGVAVAQAGAQSVGRLDQHGVAGGMTQ